MVLAWRPHEAAINIGRGSAGAGGAACKVVHAQRSWREASAPLHVDFAAVRLEHPPNMATKEEPECLYALVLGGTRHHCLLCMKSKSLSPAHSQREDD